MRDAFLIYISIFLTRTIAKILIILTENLEGNNADFELMRYVYSILNFIFSTYKIAKTDIISVQNFTENNGDFE
jgi:hypothetical protein